MDTFCLIDAGKHMASWCILTTSQEGELVWMDFKFRSVPFEGAKVLAHVKAKSINEVYEVAPPAAVEIEKTYAYRYLLDPWAREGWLSPDGKFYGCGFYGHDDIAQALLRKRVPDLEHEGWVRVHSDSFMTGRDYGREVTRRQMSSLEKLGFVELQAPGKRSARFLIDRDAPPPRCAVQPPKGFVHPHDLEVKKPVVVTREEWLSRFVGRMKEFPVLGALFHAHHDLIPDFGPGTWDWGIQWWDMYIGSEETAEELLKAEGLRLVRTSGDTMEIVSWPKPGLCAEESEKRLLGYTLRAAGQDLSLLDQIEDIRIPLQRTA